MSYAIGIDVGIKNMGFCVYDFTCNKFIIWENISLVPNGRYIPANNVAYVLQLVERYKSVFEDAAYVIVERQMRCNMRIIESVLQTLFFDRCTIVAPRCVKAHYGISMRNYKMNKEKAVEWVQNFVHSNPQTFKSGVAGTFVDSKKRDDFADSLLLVAYFLDTYSNTLTDSNGERDWV
jgi:hypothetical protein